MGHSDMGRSGRPWRVNGGFGNALKWPETILIMKKHNPYGSTIKCKTAKA